MSQNPFKIIAKTLSGLEKILAKELEGLGAEDVQPLRRAVECYGDTPLLYKINLWSRYSISVLKPAFNFTFASQQEFYDQLRKFPWDSLFEVHTTISITTVASNSVFTNSHFVSQRVKDAVVDYFRDKTNKRPNVDIENPQVKISVFINRDFCSVSLDSSGTPLFKRGYRKNQGLAPLNEVLAAGLIALTGWDQKMPLYDPMCGSATFSIEAAMIARNMAPGIFRDKYAFQNWVDFDPVLWEETRETAIKSTVQSTTPIIASDISNKTMVSARHNLMEAGLLGQVRLEKKDFFASKPYHDHGLIILNPPYGRRITDDKMPDLYNQIGTTLKHKYPGFVAWVISPDKTFTHRIGLHAAARHNIINGQLECQFLCYKLYAGSKKNLQTTEE